MSKDKEEVVIGEYKTAKIECQHLEIEDNWTGRIDFFNQEETKKLYEYLKEYYEQD